MASLQIFFTVCFTASSLLAGSVAFLPKPAFAGEALFDKNCRYYPRTTENFKGPPVNDATYIFKTLEVITNRKKYFLTVLRANNGAAVFCISQYNFMQMKYLNNAQQIQDKYIYQIVKEPDHNATFLLTLREGNGRTARTKFYKLNLNNPERPVLVQVNYRA